MFGIGLPELIVILIILAIPAAIIIGIRVIIRLSSDRPVTVKKQQPVFCTTCGAQSDGTASHCSRCGNVLMHSQSNGRGLSIGMTVPNYLAQAILVTIFCCVPLGIPAIVFAAQVNGKLAAGDYNGAVETSRKAKIWCWISFGVGLGIVLIYISLMIIAAIFEGNSY